MGNSVLIPDNFFTSFLESFLLKVNDFIKEELEANEQMIVDLNKAQLWDGKDIFGNDIRPLYSEDPYFKTPEQAQAYVDWKQKITPNSDRNPDAPNLFINGMFHRSLKLKTGTEEANILSDVWFGKEIESKYDNIEGLNDENINFVATEKILPRLIKELENELQ